MTVLWGALQVKISGLRVGNRGWNFAPVHYKDTTYPEVYRIRGYEMSSEKQEECVLVFDEPGLCQIQNVSMTDFWKLDNPR